MAYAVISGVLEQLGTILQTEVNLLEGIQQLDDNDAPVSDKVWSYSKYQVVIFWWYAKRVMLVVPLDLAITPMSVLEDATLGPKCRAMFQQGDVDDRFLIILFLTVERLRKNSAWKPYLDMLPTAFGNPLWFTDEEFFELKGTTLQTGNQESEVQFKDFLWANSIFWTRALNIPFPHSYVFPQAVEEKEGCPSFGKDSDASRMCGEVSSSLKDEKGEIIYFVLSCILSDTLLHVGLKESLFGLSYNDFSSQNNKETSSPHAIENHSSRDKQIEHFGLPDIIEQEEYNTFLEVDGRMVGFPNLKVHRFYCDKGRFNLSTGEAWIDVSIEKLQVQTSISQYSRNLIRTRNQPNMVKLVKIIENGKTKDSSQPSNHVEATAKDVACDWIEMVKQYAQLKRRLEFAQFKYGKAYYNNLYGLISFVRDSSRSSTMKMEFHLKD
ncbi:hypothetical protein IFM89_008586 [Coptis chinensis]|uniref:Uncharacterized protein n=1 Tax=Coptis chinensis TaxID=261450 RepID=A0A835I0N6_9MAGN|nr:hypothetical protein IFM89_008586 [Coptis chinensis]